MAGTDITVNILDGVANVTRQGFGTPAIYGGTEQFSVAEIGTGKSKLIFSSAVRGEEPSVEILQSGLTITFAIDSAGLVTVTIPTTGATAAEVVAAYQTADPGVQAAIIVTIDSSGSGPVAVTPITPLTFVTEFDIRSSDQVSQLLPYYNSDDPEYRMASFIFSQDLSPAQCFVLYGFGAPGADFAEKIATFDTTKWYAMLMTSTVKADQTEAANWTDLNDKLFLIASGDGSILSDLAANGSTAVWRMLDPTPHYEATIAGLQLPKTPGSTTWNAQRTNGAVAETDTATINDANDNNGNVFIKVSGLTFNNNGIMTNGLYIDQKRSRDYIKARIAENLLALIIQEDKISYDDAGIAKVVGDLANSLNKFGNEGIIAVVGSDQEAAEQSYNGVYQYSINAPTRAEVVANNPENITNRLYAMTFDYVEAGAIHGVTVTGKVVLSLV